MNKINKILITLAILVFLVSPLVSAQKTANEGQLSTLGNADKQYGTITCYLGQLFPGQPIYWCGWGMPDGSFNMFHSYFVYQQQEMKAECTIAGGVSATYTYSGK